MIAASDYFVTVDRSVPYDSHGNIGNGTYTPGEKNIIRNFVCILHIAKYIKNVNISDFLDNCCNFVFDYYFNIPNNM